MRYNEVLVRLKEKDMLIFYTDGIVDALNKKEEFYGFERFERLVADLPDEPSRALNDRILRDVCSFTEGVRQHDDMTVVVVRVV